MVLCQVPAKWILFQIEMAQHKKIGWKPDSLPFSHDDKVSLLPVVSTSYDEGQTSGIHVYTCATDEYDCCKRGFL